MSRYADYLRAQRSKRKQSPSRSGRRCRTLDLGSGVEVMLLHTRYLDVMAVRHRWSGRVYCTHCLPCLLSSDLSGAQVEEMAMSFLRKQTAPSGNGPIPAAAPDAWAREYPAVSEYLFQSTYPDGARRQLATLSIMAGDVRGLKAALNDRQEGRTLWATGECLEMVLESLDAMLQSEHTPWQVDRRTVQKVKPKGSGA